MSNVIETRNLTKNYEQGKASVLAVNDINLKIQSGEFTAIVGSSGSGKSTLLHMLGGLDTPTKGSVIIDGVDIYDLKDAALTKFRSRHIGFVFQNYNLINELTVLENIRLPLDLANIKYDKQYEDDIIDLLHLNDRVKFFPPQLSGGQQQRVAIARALISKPNIILADEPTGNLDKRSSDAFFQYMKDTNEELNQTYVMVTHNLDLAIRTKRILSIDDGKIVDDRIM